MNFYKDRKTGITYYYYYNSDGDLKMFKLINGIYILIDDNDRQL